MHVVIVSTYPPRQCGIATFSRDLRRGMLAADPEATVELVASLQEGADPDDQRPEVVHTFVQADPASHVEAARRINAQHPDAVVIEHEYGIFGGDDGDAVIDLVRELEAPAAVTLHTVLTEPSIHQDEVLGELCELATWVFVMSQRAREILLEARPHLADKIHVVPHGVPTDLLFSEGMDRADQRQVLLTERDIDLTGRTMLSTFGLISPNKGLEVAIRAMPAIVERHPEVLYVIAGRTHPEIVRRQGEAYRESLESLVDELGVRDHVVFADGYLSDEELESLLGQTRIFVTPYLGKEQIVSGALTFALAAGCAIVSTPYTYAQDQLANGAGWLVPFNDPQALAEAVNAALDDPDMLRAARRAAREIGADLAWPSVGGRALELLADPSATAE